MELDKGYNGHSLTVHIVVGACRVEPGVLFGSIGQVCVCAASTNLLCIKTAQK